jgi:tRNA A37 methylthiotransferase MiaB
LPDHVPVALKKARARRMRELGAQKKQAFYARFIGQTVSVLVETKIDGATGLQRGFSRNYLPVTIAGAGFANKDIAVALKGMRNGWLSGIPLTAESEGLDSSGKCTAGSY